MVARNRRLVGWAVAVAGAVLAIVGGLADQLGLGGEGPDEFGPSQVAAVVAGIVIVLAGLALALWPSRPAEPS
ncbi:MAG TPA: hypothetical protein VFZ79_12225 [Acidimicrobiales bacterium]